ncbi:MAG: hypothetical protein WC960_03800 [Bacteroidales bacterium]
MEERKGSEKSPLTHIEDIAEEAKNYIELRIEHLKLKIVEALSSIVSKLSVLLIALLLIIIAIAFLAVALNLYLSALFNSNITGALTTALIFIVIAIIVLLFRNRLFVNSLTSLFSAQILESPLNRDSIVREQFKVGERIAAKEIRLKERYTQLRESFTLMNLFTRSIRRISLILPFLISLKGIYEKVKKLFQKEGSREGDPNQVGEEQQSEGEVQKEEEQESVVGQQKEGEQQSGVKGKE